MIYKKNNRKSIIDMCCWQLLYIYQLHNLPESHKDYRYTIRKNIYTVVLHIYILIICISGVYVLEIYL